MIYASAPTSPHPFSCGQVETLEIFDLKVLLQRASVLLRLPQSTCAWEPVKATKKRDETWEWSEIHWNRPKCKVVP